jgi:hypothetical protein
VCGYFVSNTGQRKNRNLSSDSAAAEEGPMAHEMHV